MPDMETRTSFSRACEMGPHLSRSTSIGPPAGWVGPPPHGQFSEDSDGKKIGHRIYGAFPAAVVLRLWKRVCVVDQEL